MVVVVVPLPPDEESARPDDRALPVVFHLFDHLLGTFDLVDHPFVTVVQSLAAVVTTTTTAIVAVVVVAIRTIATMEMATANECPPMKNLRGTRDGISQFHVAVILKANCQDHVFRHYVTRMSDVSVRYIYTWLV